MKSDFVIFLMIGFVYKSLLILLVLFCTVNIECVKAQSLYDSLVAYYTFNNDVNDYSGSNLHGIIHGTTTFVDGRIGEAVHFNNSVEGVNDYVELPLIKANEMSVSLWVNYQSAISEYGGLIYQIGNPCSDTCFSILLFDNGELRTAVYSDFGETKTKWYVISDTIDKNKWFHIAVTIENSIIKLYVDGKFSKSVVFPFLLNHTPSCHSVGLTQWGETGEIKISRINGAVDELYIFSRILTEDDIKKLSGIKYSISGSVILSEEFADTGKVVLYDLNNGNQPVDIAYFNDGIFGFDAVLPGDYILSANYLGNEYGGFIETYYPSTDLFEKAEVVHVNSNKSNIQIELIHQNCVDTCYIVQGYVHTGNSLLENGVVKLLNTDKHEIIDSAIVLGGEFKIRFIHGGIYYLLAEPRGDVALIYDPTYYVDEIDISKATILPVFGGIREIDISLVKTFTPLNTINKDQIVIYPNPVKHELIIIPSEYEQIKQIRISDQTGHIHFKLDPLETGRLQLNLNSLIPGYYIIEVVMQNNTIVRDKIIKI